MKNTERNELAVCGFAAVKTLEKVNPQKIQRLYFTEELAPKFGGLCKKLASEKKPYNQVSDSRELERLCGSVHHQGVVAMIAMPEILPLTKTITSSWADKNEHAILLDRVGNANNLGAIVRSAAFFGIKNIVIPLDEAQSSVTTSSYRVAEGGMEFVNVYSIKSIPYLLSDMKGRMIRIGTAMDGKHSTQELSKITEGKASIIVLGNEEHGISDDVRKNCDFLVSIPYRGPGKDGNGPVIDSLNVAQAASIVCYELSN